MILHVTDAKYDRAYRLRVRFNDGAEGTVDLRNDLRGPMFVPLKNIRRFKDFRVDPELETIVWGNGADLAPEFLRSKLTVKSSQKARPSR